MKVITKGKHLWLRTVSSTAAGQLVDTVIVMVVAFAGTANVRTIVTLILSGYLGKVVYEAAMTPVTYLVVNGLKRTEGVDVFDSRTDFNPFHSSRSEAPQPEGSAPILN